MKRTALVVAWALVITSWSGLLVGCNAQSAAQTTEGEKPAAAEIAAEAKPVLDAWYAALAKAKTFSADTRASFVVLQAGQEVQAQKEVYRVALEQPGKFAVRLVEGEGFTIVNDGKQLYQLDHTKRVYVSDPAPATLKELEKSVVLSRTHLQLGLPLVSDAMAGLPLEKILAPYQKIAYVGLETVDGAKQHHLQASRDGVRMEWFFDEAAPHALRKIQPNPLDIAAKNGREPPPGIELKFALTYDNVAYDSAVDQKLFEVAPPADAAKLANLDDPIAMTLVGKPAPAVELPTLDGGKFNLAEQKGKIVVLDFWATWCPPCVEGLPKLAAMTAKHKDDGVVFFPINLQEEPDTIKAFLAEKGLTLPIVLDADGKAVKSYKVEPVPQTVFIDRDGVVQLVHIGIGELEKVPEQLKDLIAGKKLAAVPNESAERK